MQAQAEEIVDGGLLTEDLMLGVQYAELLFSPETPPANNNAERPEMNRRYPNINNNDNNNDNALDLSNVNNDFENDSEKKPRRRVTKKRSSKNSNENVAELKPHEAVPLFSRSDFHTVTTSSTIKNSSSSSAPAILQRKRKQFMNRLEALESSNNSTSSTSQHLERMPIGSAATFGHHPLGAGISSNLESTNQTSNINLKILDSSIVILGILIFLLLGRKFYFFWDQQ